jgi:adenylate cyclase
LLRQFSPQVAERLEGMLREGDYLRLGGGERAEPVTILSSDVRGFTALSAQMEPHEVVAMLNELFSVCIPIIFKYKGTVDKYVGDAVLAVFGSPDPDDHQWENAVWAALEMQEAIADLGEDRASRGLPVCQVGVGIHTGAVLHGFIGSEEHMEYTVIGDAVNRATRYCDGAGPTEVVISESVYEHVSDMVEVEPKTIKSKHSDTEGDLEAYLVKGSQKPVD